MGDLISRQAVLDICERAANTCRDIYTRVLPVRTLCRKKLCTGTKSPASSCKWMKPIGIPITDNKNSLSAPTAGRRWMEVRRVPKTNPLILKAVEAEINRRILRGELLLPDVVKKNLNANLDCQRMMMTIAVNRALKVGKKRFNELVNPVLQEIEKEFHENKRETDQDYALGVIEREYNRIME